MKTKEELFALKEELDTMKSKLAELSEDELTEVTGGLGGPGGLFDRPGFHMIGSTAAADIGVLGEPGPGVFIKPGFHMTGSADTVGTGDFKSSRVAPRSIDEPLLKD